MKWLVYVTMLLLGFAAGWFARGCVDGNAIKAADTVTVVDTIPYYRPVPRDSIVVRYVTEKLPIRTENVVSGAEPVRDDAENVDSNAKNDNIAHGNIPDSVEVIVPITQKVYADSLYRAYVSGYRPRLDSIFVYPRTRYVTVTRQAKPQRWGIGVQAGYGVGRGGTGPYVGIGVSYNLFTF